MVSDMYTVCFVRAPGEGTLGKWWARGEERAFASGDVIVSEPGEAQYVKSADGPASFFFVCVHPDIVTRLATELGLPEGLHWKTPFLEPGRHPELLARLAAAVHSPDESHTFVEAFHDAMAELVVRGADTGTATKRTGNANHPGIRRAMERLATNFREATTLDDLAKEARLSKFHFVRCFRQATGLSPHRYRKLLRVLEARRLLEHGMSVAEAAGQASFADASHLSRTFREWLGVTPGLWASAWRASEPSERSAPRTMPPPSSESLPASDVG
ncbi:MAG TPA: AraC family transcriptional regulator [Polyangiaceae bacterium]|nr:AraC family transcriptional regulator [Polyangiaceae bacterium]